MAKKKVKVKLWKDGVRALLKSEEVQECVTGYAEQAVQRLGEGYEATSKLGQNRAVAQVKAVWNQTRAQNARENSIIKALGGGK